MTGAAPAGPASTAAPADPGAAGVLHTRLCRRFGVKYPVVQTAMGYVSDATLTAATANGGGLGILSAVLLSPAEMSAAVDAVRAATDAPFGVNILANAGDAAERIERLIRAKVPVVSFAMAPKADLVARCKDAGVAVVSSIGARRHAEKVAAWGADAVIVQGAEGGGHTGGVPTSLLLPQVVDALAGSDTLVIGAGGFFDGRGLVAALAYGADGIAMGTRFLLTSDSPVADAVKQFYLGKAVTDTVVTTEVDGIPQRLLRNPTVDALTRTHAPRRLARAARNAVAYRKMSGTAWSTLMKDGLAMRKSGDLSWSQTVMAANAPMLYRTALLDGRPDVGVMATGQVVGLIDDLPSCAELIERIMDQAADVVRALAP